MNKNHLGYTFELVKYRFIKIKLQNRFSQNIVESIHENFQPFFISSYTNSTDFWDEYSYSLQRKDRKKIFALVETHTRWRSVLHESRASRVHTQDVG